MTNKYAIVLTTTDDATKAATLAKKVVEEKLAACAQIIKIESYFMWDGALDQAGEYLILLKTRADLYEELEAFVKANHDYDVPEILQLPVTNGFGGYLSWMDENTK